MIKKLSFKIPQIKLSKKEKMLAAVSLLVISMVAMDRLAVTAWVGRMEMLRTEIDALERSIVNGERLLQRKGQIQRQMDRFKRYLKPGAGGGLQTATFLKEIEGIAKQNQIGAFEIKTQEGESNDLYQVYVFDVEGESDYPQWMRFLHALESSPSLFEVQRARIGVKEGTEGTLGIGLRLTAISFRWPGESVPAATEKPSK